MQEKRGSQDPACSNERNAIYQDDAVTKVTVIPAIF